MKSLKLLDLSETAAVGNEGLEHLKGLMNLEDLILMSCQIDDNGLANLDGLKNLKRLNLDHCKITDDGLAHLAPLKNLEFLHIGNTRGDRRGPRAPVWAEKAEAAGGDLSARSHARRNRNCKSTCRS